MAPTKATHPPRGARKSRDSYDLQQEGALEETAHPSCDADDEGHMVPIISGMLAKRAQGRSTFGRTNWKKRWFVLYPHELAYWTQEGGAMNPSAECKGTIKLRDITCIERVQLEAFGKPYMLQIVHSSVLYVQCSSRQECDEWLHELRALCARNPFIHNKYHPGFFDSSKWTCCNIPHKDYKGCEKAFNYASLLLSAPAQGGKLVPESESKKQASPSHPREGEETQGARTAAKKDKRTSSPLANEAKASSVASSETMSCSTATCSTSSSYDNGGMRDERGPLHSIESPQQKSTPSGRQSRDFSYVPAAKRPSGVEQTRGHNTPSALPYTYHGNMEPIVVTVSRVAYV